MDKQEPQLLCLRWNNHQSNLVSVFDQLLQNEAFCDVTLAVDGRTVKCHQMVLAASSPYFQSIFMENTCKHPIVFLKDMRYSHIKSLVEYIYYGEAAVPEDQLQGLLKIAESLKIKGLVEIDEDKGPNEDSRKKDIPSGYQSPPPTTTPNTSTTIPTPGRISVATNLMNPVPSTPSNGGKEEDAGELIIDEDSMTGSSIGPITAEPPLASNSNGVTPIEVSPEYPGFDDTPPAPGMIRVVNAQGKAEWKRYKQYTKDDILAAIEEVKNGMSALQASRKYGVPSRTLYDKVKKMGILTANMQKQIQQKKQPVPILPSSSSGSSTPVTTTPSTTTSPAPPPINFLGLQVPQANLPVINGLPNNSSNASTNNSADKTSTPNSTVVQPNLFVPNGGATIVPGSNEVPPPISRSLMMSVMSMMSEKLKADALKNSQGVPSENLNNLLKKSSTTNSNGEGSDSGLSSEEQERDIAVKEEKSDDDIKAVPEKVDSNTAAQQQILNQLYLNSLAAATVTNNSLAAANVTNNSLAAANNSSSSRIQPVKLTPRTPEDINSMAVVIPTSSSSTTNRTSPPPPSQSTPVISPTRSSSVITATSAALLNAAAMAMNAAKNNSGNNADGSRKRKLSGEDKTAANLDSKDMSEVKKLLVEPAKQEAA